MAVRSLTPLSDWPAGPHPSCNGRFVVPRHSVCTRLHASSSLDNPMPSRFPNPPPFSNLPSTWLTSHPRRSRQPPSYLELYQNIITGCRVQVACICICLYAGNAHSHTYVQRCPSRGLRTIFSYMLSPFPLVHDTNRQAR